MTRLAVWSLAAIFAASSAAAQTGTVDRRVDPAKDVIVIANDNVPASVDVALHYCDVRKIPAANVLHVKCSDKEVVTWPEFRKDIRAPFAEFLKKFPEAIYVVPTFGIPSRISEEDASNDNPTKSKDNTLEMFVTGRDYCCLDAELALELRPDHERDGWIISEGYEAETGKFTRNVHVTREDKLLLVSRLDGPTPAIARALVDKAIYAETYGIEGQNYLDTRGLHPPNGYGYTDDEMRATKDVFEKYGLALNCEDTEEEEDVSKLKDCLFYWGWYAGDWNGTQPAFQFKTGAVAAHLHSCSACSVRSDTKFWVGPLLAHGVTCTTGTVYEPLTFGFPSMGVIYDRLFQGYSWGEASNMGNRALSWMAVFVGDPLYAPFAKGMKEAQEKNRALAADGYGRIASLIEAGDLDAAELLVAEIDKIGVPYEGAQDVSLLSREIAARRVTKGSGTIADLVKALADGKAALTADDAKAAEAAFQKAVALSPACFDANLGLASIQIAAGHPTQALPFLEKAAKVVPASPLLAWPMGQALAASAKFKEAIPWLEKGLDAGGPDAMAALGDCYLKTGAIDKAIQFLGDAVKADPANRTAALALARAHEVNRDTANQLVVLVAAVKIPPKSVDDLPAYRNAWKQLQTAADRAKDKKESENASLIVKDLENHEFDAPGKGVSIQIAKQVDDLAGESGLLTLGDVPSQARKVAGMPVAQVFNASPAEITIYLKGPCSRTIKLGKFGGGKVEPKEIGLYPGEYEIAIVCVKGPKDRSVIFGRKTIELSKEYGMTLDSSFGLGFPKK